MTHKEALNKILSNACEMMGKDDALENDGFQKYHIELHCAEFIIEAKSNGKCEYEIRSVTAPDGSDCMDPDGYEAWVKAGRPIPP
jgi:hypothetical protein